MHLNGSVWVCMYTHTHTQTHTKYLSEGKKNSKGPHNLNTEGIIFLWSKCWKEKESTKKVLSLFLWMSTSAFIIAVSGCRGEASSCWELTPITTPPPHPTWVQPMGSSGCGPFSAPLSSSLLLSSFGTSSLALKPAPSTWNVVPRHPQVGTQTLLSQYPPLYIPTTYSHSHYLLGVP